MTKYCTLDFAKSELDTSKTSKTLDDAQIFAYIEATSQRIDGLLQPQRRLKKRPFFAPYIESRSAKIRDWRVNSGDETFDLNMWLLELTTVLAGAQNVTSKIIAIPAGFAPFNQLQINTGNHETWYTLEDAPTIRRRTPNPLTITGKWGWNDDWANAWIATSTVAAAGIVSPTQTTFDVAAAGGLLFSPGHMIKVDTEYMEITGISTDTLTVIRGVNGSTAAIHAAAALVSILDIPDDIQRITARHASALYARRGSFEAQQLTQVGVVQYPQDLLMEMDNTLNTYRM